MKKVSIMSFLSLFLLADVKEIILGAGISAKVAGEPKLEFLKACEEVGADYCESDDRFASLGGCYGILY